MNLRKLSNNVTEVELTNETIVLFSYATPVAAKIGREFVRTDLKWSNTTTRHINNWLAGETARVVPQSFIDDLAK